MFLQLVDSLCYYFIADDHWWWFIDEPGFVEASCWKRRMDLLGWFLVDVSEMLKEGLLGLYRTEAYRDYGRPYIGKWQEEVGA